MTQKKTCGRRRLWTNRLKRTVSLGPITHEVTMFEETGNNVPI